LSSESAAIASQRAAKVDAPPSYWHAMKLPQAGQYRGIGSVYSAKHRAQLLIDNPHFKHRSSSPNVLRQLHLRHFPIPKGSSGSSARAPSGAPPPVETVGECCDRLGTCGVARGGDTRCTLASEERSRAVSDVSRPLPGILQYSVQKEPLYLTFATERTLQKKTKQKSTRMKMVQVSRDG
jgi:hypothetical protein